MSSLAAGLRLSNAIFQIERHDLANLALPVIDADDGFDAQVFDEYEVHGESGIGNRESGIGNRGIGKEHKSYVIPAKAGIQRLRFLNGKAGFRLAPE